MERQRIVLLIFFLIFISACQQTQILVEQNIKNDEVITIEVIPEEDPEEVEITVWQYLQENSELANYEIDNITQKSTIFYEIVIKSYLIDT